MHEIGSEFWINCSDNSSAHGSIWDSWPGNLLTFLSGRTALSAILDDICLISSHQHPAIAYLPSYCCHTMIEPFLRHGMMVEFYSVKFNDGEFKQEIDSSKVCDIVLILDYFGFSRDHCNLPKNAVVIRDMTHAAFSRPPYICDANYTFASFRKWGAIAGAAIAIKQHGLWLIEEATRQNTAYLALRYTGYRDKAKYIAGDAGIDKSYLHTFQQAESLLDSDYENYAADDESLRKAEYLYSFATQRRKNAQKLLSGLRTISVVEPLFQTLFDNDTPLFVPVFVKDGRRDTLRRYMIENSIYCPVHWPISLLHRINNDERKLYDTELSLVCDQRYSEPDMDRQLNIIRRFELENA